MVKKPSNSEKTSVTRIKASDTSGTKSAKNTGAEKTAPAKKVTKVKPAISVRQHEEKAKAEKRATSKSPLTAIGRYFKGAWQELKLVRWPDRASTWKMTGALLVFTLFFVVLIVLLDFGFAKLFKVMLGTE